MIGSAPARFLAKFIPEPNSGCWLWTAGTMAGGYGVFWDGSRHLAAHRFSYELHREPIPLGLVIDHKCRNPCCVNPAHLEPVTYQTNTLRGRVGVKPLRTHCRHGHPYSGKNVVRNKFGFRACLACQMNAVARRELSRLRRRSANLVLPHQR